MDNRQEASRQHKDYIRSRSPEMFRDRIEAGRFLAEELTLFQGRSPVVLGIPRGGIVIAREIARRLGGQLDVVFAHKLGTPGYEELAMGAVAEDGSLFMNKEVTDSFRVSPSAIENERIKQLDLIKRRAVMVRKIRPRVKLKGRIVIVTDDGVATGSTTQAAIWAVRTEQPAKLVLAVPVGPEDTIIKLAQHVDEMLCLRSPPAFVAVGQFYQHFYPIEDEDVLEILAKEMQNGNSAST